MQNYLKLDRENLSQFFLSKMKDTTLDKCNDEKDRLERVKGSSQGENGEERRAKRRRSQTQRLQTSTLALGIPTVEP